MASKRRNKHREIKKVINNEINDEFGLGDTRSLQDYENLCGVDLKNMKVLDKQKAYTSEFISKLSGRTHLSR